MSSLRDKEGYLMIDHRQSPGIPADMARQIGLDPKLCGEGKLLEAATLTCSHCKSVVMKNPLRQRARANCLKCSHYICDFCDMASKHPDYKHLPFEKFVDIAQTLGERGINLCSSQELLQLSTNSLNSNCE